MRYIESPTETSGAGKDVKLFLAGGITGTDDWQSQVVELLKGSNLTLVNPRRKNWDNLDPKNETIQIEWEYYHLLRVDAIMFWFPPQTLCPIALFELGSWIHRPKPLFIGCDPEYKRKNDVVIQTRLARPTTKVHSSLIEVVDSILKWEANLPHQD
jgi:hypothetical protein